MSGIYLGLGTNLGNREKNLSLCLKELANSGEITLVRLSSVYESEPCGYYEQPNFYNMALEIATDLNPFQLLDVIKGIEQKMGRKKTFHWGPRIIDIDILTYQNIVIDYPVLTIPHQHLHLRRFVLIPLKEITDRFIHPKFKKNIDQMLKECSDDGQIKLIMHETKLLINLK